jgi:hypothetical protein
LPVSAKFSKITLEEFMRPWAELCAAYPRQEVGAATARKYHERLQKFDVATIQAAINIAIDRNKFFPTVAEIIENIAAMTPKAGLLSGSRPTKEEAKAVLDALHQAIQDYENVDLQKIADRKALLREQARKLGVK